MILPVARAGIERRSSAFRAQAKSEARCLCWCKLDELGTNLEGVPIAVIAAWLGHASSAFTMATYVHSQEPALADAVRRMARVVIRIRSSRIEGAFEVPADGFSG